MHINSLKTRLCVSLCAWLALGLLNRALTAQPQQDADKAGPFRAAVDLVALNVTTSDPKKRFVGGLTENDFTVFEDGVPQELSFFAEGRMPLDLAVLLDTSASMTNILSTAQQAAIGFVSTAQPDDRISVIEISDRANVLVPLGGDVPTAVDAIRHTTARGSTALYNALYLALTDMNRLRKSGGDIRRQAIAVLSDGQDTSSLVQYDDVMMLAKSSGIAIYTIALVAPTEEWRLSSASKANVQSEFLMRSFAQETGGLTFVARDVRELDAIYAQIASVLAQQYTLGYISKNAKADGVYRRVSIKVSNHPGVTAHTRSGYFASRTRTPRLSN
jgi:Ca-activated chloride channel family protein